MRVAYSHGGKEQAFESEKSEVVIGRPKDGEVPDLDLTPDQRVSRRHARIWMEGGQYWIEDLGSKHGTLVDGVDIRGKGKVMLTPGVPVRMGNTTLVLMADQKAEGEKGGKGEGQKGEEPPPSVKVRVQVSCLPTVNYSLVHADVPFLSEVTVFNEGDGPMKDVKVQILLGGYAESEIVQIPLIPAKRNHKVDRLPKFQFYRHKLQDLPVPDTVALEVCVNGERVPLNPAVEVTVLPPNAWHCLGHEEALAGFVMPHSDAVEEIVSRARFHLRRLLKGAKGFADALESTDPKAVEKTIKALYFCLQERYGITYEYEPRTYAPDWQMVRFHYELLEELEATCIDAALLFAACLENVGRDPLIIIIKTGLNLQHAIIGCWRRGSPLNGGVITDETKLRQWVNSGEILVLDSKGFPKTREFPDGMAFTDCRNKGVQHIENYPLVYGLDIVAAREAGIAPMPFGEGVQYDRAAWLAMFRARREAERLQSESVGARHLLLGLLSLENGLMRRVFARIGKDVADKVADGARKSLRPAKSARRWLPEDDNWQAVMQRAERTAAQEGDSLVTEADLATALLETPSQVVKVLEHCGLTRRQCLDTLREIVKGGPIPSVWHSSGFVGR